MDNLDLSKEQIKEIAGSNDVGLDVFLDTATLELIGVPSMEKYAIDELDEYYAADRTRIESDEESYIRIACPSSQDSYEIMFSFTELLETSSLKAKLLIALDQPKPFRNFKRIINHSALRKDWFEYKDFMLEKRVEKIIAQHNC